MKTRPPSHSTASSRKGARPVSARGSGAEGGRPVHGAALEPHFLRASARRRPRAAESPGPAAVARFLGRHQVMLASTTPTRGAFGRASQYPDFGPVRNHCGHFNKGTLKIFPQFLSRAFYTVDSSQEGGENSFLTRNITGFIGHLSLPRKSLR